MPFAGYKNFAACVRANGGKKNPQAYCGAIMHAVEGKSHEYHVEIDNQMRSFGETHYDEGRIKLNLAKGDVVNTIIHEKLHAEHPHMTEDEVRRMAAKMEGGMSMPAMAGLLMETHRKVQEPSHYMDIVHTEASKVVQSVVK